MPRTPITTVYAPRFKPSTQYNRPRNWDLMLLTCDTTLFTCDTIEITCDSTQTWMPLIETQYNRPRKASILFDEQWLQLELENWELLLEEWGNKDNIIQTVYT